MEQTSARTNKRRRIVEPLSKIHLIKYDWAKQVKEFDETKASVKGLVDAGIKKVPEFFIYPPESLENLPPKFPLELPTVDFEGVEGGRWARRREVVEGIRVAASKWGFFRMVNHGVPSGVMEGMLEAARRFHEQRREDKMEYYSGDCKRRIISNDEFISVEHRVLAQPIGPRVSVASCMLLQS
ncbi:hypothetical protein RHSIM_Rhsim01G0265800 [Rhododendron simsii]|uniref:Non-haem dioxygenase N-terminal domain-containing protein n=1 Tax=Rhododendron simsii TaxID=118357 RepID=A0A834HJG1_RHOSS|nr:hypothetical protein RHSIM_Rhsim01G0265800 [Rhododendron simsii]